MRWLEIIELRSVGCNRELLESQLQNLIKEVEMESIKPAIEIYSRIRLDTDFGIHLFHSSKIIENYGSSLGLRLASNLKEFGLVNHKVWVDLND